MMTAAEKEAFEKAINENISIKNDIKKLVGIFTKAKQVIGLDFSKMKEGQGAGEIIQDIVLTVTTHPLGITGLLEAFSEVQGLFPLLEKYSYLIEEIKSDPKYLS